MKKSIVSMLLPAIFCCGSIDAASISDTKITMLMLDQGHGDKVYIKTSKTHPSDTPTCHDSVWSYVLPLSTPLHDKMYSMLLAAKTADITVNLTGENANCATHNNIETLRRIEYK